MITSSVSGSASSERGYFKVSALRQKNVRSIHMPFPCNSFLRYNIRIFTKTIKIAVYEPIILAEWSSRTSVLAVVLAVDLAMVLGPS